MYENNMLDNLQNNICEIIKHYQKSFKDKIQPDDNQATDILMDLFNITYETKATNKQFWGRELGMLWQKIVTEVFKDKEGFKEPKKFGKDEPYDLQFGNDCIDTKYRIGSGDAGTLKKFKQYAKLIKSEGNNPVLLFLREDNLPAAITACINGGWKIYKGQESFDYIKQHTGINLQEILQEFAGKFTIN